METRDFESRSISPQATRTLGIRFTTGRSERRYSYQSPFGADTTTRYSVTDKDANKTTYTYDDITRLRRARMTNSSGATELEDYEYSYDNNGNLLTKTLSGSSVANENVKYDYNSANELT